LIGASFDSTKTPLQELLARADTGKLQLTDFQRAWVWDDDRIRGLLASVSVSFSIGAVMLLENGWRERRRLKEREGAGRVLRAERRGKYAASDGRAPKVAGSDHGRREERRQKPL
jgi:hypothetical protein